MTNVLHTERRSRLCFELNVFRRRPMNTVVITLMYTAPPIPNLLDIRSPNIERAVTFYETLGIRFERHSHGQRARALRN